MARGGIKNKESLLYEILLEHDAKTLSPEYPDHSKLNVMLDHLLGMLADIWEQEQEPNGYVTKAIVRLIKTENEQMEAMRQTDPGMEQEK